MSTHVRVFTTDQVSAMRQEKSAYLCEGWMFGTMFLKGYAERLMHISEHFPDYATDGTKPLGLYTRSDGVKDLLRDNGYNVYECVETVSSPPLP